MKKFNNENIIKVLQGAKGDIIVPGSLQETPDHRAEFLSLAEQIRQHGGVGSSAFEGGNELPMLKECVENDLSHSLKQGVDWGSS